MKKSWSCANVKGGVIILSKKSFIEKLNEVFQEQTSAGKNQVTISAGELHRLVGGYPGINHQMPICCTAMKEVFDKTKDEILNSRLDGIDSMLTIQYALPR